MVPYLNRLSDLCWLLARAAEQDHLTARALARAGSPSKGMMAAMHLPLRLHTEVTGSIPAHARRPRLGSL